MSKLDDLKKLLKELFQLDRADLDFGIYRIMHYRAAEIEAFLEKDLLPQVRAALDAYSDAHRKELKHQLEAAREDANKLGVDPDSVPKVAELQAKISGAAETDRMESEVYSDLYRFFRRYYTDGDFLSLRRRHGEEVYSVPYSGEEVKFHWANADQYYIKNTEVLSNYAFQTPDGRRVRFELSEATTETDDRKPSPGREARFILSEDPLSEEHLADGSKELVVKFDYRPAKNAERQTNLNAQAVEALAEGTSHLHWRRQLLSVDGTDATPDRTLFEKQLTRFTARQAFDYFIHRDLGEFLRRELDFFIKNEVMHLDDVENESAPRVEKFLAKIRSIRVVAEKLIAFLSQTEDFQRKLWLKKKFVVETSYCLTLDHIPEKLYPEVAANDSQVEEWVEQYCIDEIKGDLTEPAFTKPPSVDFLKRHQSLVLDTRHFTPDFIGKVLSEFEDLDGLFNGTLVQSNNAQAVSLLEARYSSAIKTVYNDPPYNTDASAILYKNGYRSSTWCTLMHQVSTGCHRLLSDDGTICTTIDDEQLIELTAILRDIFGHDNHLGTIAIRSNPSGRIRLRGMAQCHEYAIFFSKTELGAIAKLPRSDKQLSRFDQKDSDGVFEWRNFRRDGSSSTRFHRPKQFFPIFVTESSVRIPELRWDGSKSEYEVLEKKRPDEKLVWPIDAKGDERCWRWGLDTARTKLAELAAKTNPQGVVQVYNKYRPNAEGVLPLTIWSDKKYSSTEYGTALVKNVFGTRAPFDFPKSLFATKDCLHISSIGPSGTVLDCFAGSGTTGHAVIALNREDGGARKYVLVEMGAHFDSVLVPRLKRAVYAEDWRNGKPAQHNTGVSQAFRILRLESYDDTLNNIELSRTEAQQSLISKNPRLKEGYLLRYMLDVESKRSVLSVEKFIDPWAYKIRVARDGETRLHSVDLIDSFNWLLGLRVAKYRVDKEATYVLGTDPEGAEVLVIWRRVAELPSEELNSWFQERGFASNHHDFDKVYVNGDNLLGTLRRESDRWSVHLIEEAFHRLMFETDES